MRWARGSITPMLIAVLLSCLYFWHGGKSTLFLAAVSMLIVVYGVFLHVFGPHHIHIHRNIRQGQIAVGENILVQVELQVKCPLPLLWLVVCDRTPGGIHRKLLFPGLKRQWSYQYKMTGLARGVHAWEEGRVYWGDVFGWNRAYTTIKGEEPVVVVPAAGNAGLPIWSGGWLHHGEGMGLQYQLQGGSGTEVREYQQGDSFNRIHWKSTARTGKLHTRIPEMSPSTALNIMVYEEISGYERFSSEEQAREQFERAVQGAASWVREAANVQMPCQLWLSGEELASQSDMPLEGISWNEAKASRNYDTSEGRRSNDDPDESLTYALKRLAYARLRKERVNPGIQLDVSRLEQLPYGSSIVIFTGQLDERLVVWLEYASALGLQASVYLTETRAENKGQTEIRGELSFPSRGAVTSNASVNAMRSEEWNALLISKGISVVYQETSGASGFLLSGKAAVVDVGA